MKLPLLAVSYNQTFVEQTEDIDNNCLQLWNALFMSGLKLLSVTKGKLDT